MQQQDTPSPPPALFERLRALFTQDPLIDEIGLVFGIEEDELTVENAFVLEEHKLGVAFSAGPQLFRQARTRFHELNPLLLRQAGGAGDVDKELATQLVDCTRAVLLISADFYTAWNTRRLDVSKELVCRGVLDALAETRFCDLVFTLHPKSIDTWAYRRWLATRLLSSPASLLSSSRGDEEETLNAFYQRQLSACGLLAEQKPRNYHAWSFRHWIVSQLPLAVLGRELVDMQQWCATHITDHSGWNHRQHVVNVLLRRWGTALETDPDALIYGQRVKGLVVDEYTFLSKIMGAYPAHEALWCHRRFVMQLVLRELCGPTKGNIDAAGLAVLNKRVVELDAKARLATEADTHADPGASTGGAEALSTGWQGIEASLRDLEASDGNHTYSQLQVLLAMISEVEIAWGFGSRFSRRFALWSLERVLQLSSSSSVDELESLARTLREALSSHDPLLQDLWENRR